MAAASGAELPLNFDDPADGMVLARYPDERFVALLIVYPWEFDEDEDESERWPFEHDIAVYGRAPDGFLTHSAGGGSDWRLGLDPLPPHVPLWLSGFSLGTRFGTFVSGAVSDPARLERLSEIGAEASVSSTDAPTGAFVVRLRDDDAAPEEWEAHLRRPEVHDW